MENYLFEEMARTAEQHWWFVARREILAGLITGLGLPTPAQTRIAEIGCGTGGNLAMLGGFGQVWALESDPVAFRYIRSGTADVQAGRLGDELPFPPASYDLVCLLDVLEHVEDDVGGLTAAARLVRPDGWMMVTVPAYQWLFGPHDIAHHHFRRYTASSLKQVALEVGLEVERIGYFNTFLFPLIATARLFGRFLRYQGGHEHSTALPAPWLNRLLYSIFAAENSLVAHRFLPFGTSVIAILKASSTRKAANECT